MDKKNKYYIIKELKIIEEFEDLIIPSIKFKLSHMEINALINSNSAIYLDNDISLTNEKMINSDEIMCEYITRKRNERIDNILI